MRIPRLLILTVAALALPFPARAAVSLTMETQAGSTCYRLDNGRVSLLIAPDQGGAVISYKDRLGGDVDLISHKSPRGLCLDHFQSQHWPGEMLSAKYEVTGQQADPQACSLSLRYVLTGKTGDGSGEDVKGVTLEKTYLLRADSPALECRIKITAPEKESRLLAYWQQHIFFPGGQYSATADKTFRPSARGVMVGDGANQPAESFLSDYTAGWSALLDTTRKTGLVSLTDYNELNFLYDCSNTTVEPMFRRTFLPAGKSVEYTTYVVPVVGLDNVVSATSDYIAGYTMKSDGKGAGAASFSVIRSVHAPASLTLQVSVKNVLQPTLAAAGTVSFGPLSEQVQTKEVSFTGAGPDPLVLQVAAVVKDPAGAVVAGKFEDYFNGAYGYGRNITADMMTPVYKGERPQQKLTLLKPSPLKLKPAPSPQIWYAEGLMDDYYDLGPAAHILSLGKGGGLDRVFLNSTQFGTLLSSFPWDYDKLLSYQLVILGGVRDDSLGNLGQAMLGDFVSAGGAVLMLGGPTAYGPSGLRGTPLADLLPVEINPKPFDLVKLPAGVVKPTPEGAPFLEDLDWSPAPAVRYVHKVAVKPWGKVVLEADGHPFLVVGETGPNKARVACLLGAPLGDFSPGQTPFWQWSDWKYLLRQLLWWEMKEDRFTPYQR